MQKQTTQLTSKQWVDQMLREHYEKARQAKAATYALVQEFAAIPLTCALTPG